MRANIPGLYSCLLERPWPKAAFHSIVFVVICMTAPGESRHCVKPGFCQFGSESSEGMDCRILPRNALITR